MAATAITQPRTLWDTQRLPFILQAHIYCPNFKGEVEQKESDKTSLFRLITVCGRIGGAELGTGPSDESSDVRGFGSLRKNPLVLQNPRMHWTQDFLFLFLLLKNPKGKLIFSCGLAILEMFGAVSLNLFVVARLRTWRSFASEWE